MNRLIGIFFLLGLIDGCGVTEEGMARADELCRLLFRNGLAESSRDSLVALSEELPVAARLEVLLEAIRNDPGRELSPKIAGWLDEAWRIAPEGKRPEIEMVRIRYLDDSAGTSGRADVRRETLFRLEKTYRLTPVQQAWLLYYKIGDSDMLVSWNWMRESLALAHKENLPMLEVRVLEKSASMAVWAGDYEQGIEWWQEAFRVRSRTGLPVDKWGYWSWQQNYLFRAGRYPEALGCWEELRGMTEDRKIMVKVLRGMAEVYRKMNRLPETSEMLRLAMTYETTSHERALIAGEMAEVFRCREMNDSLAVYYARAVKTWEDILPGGKMTGVAMPVYAGYAQVLWEKGKKDKAVKMLGRTLENIPRYTLSDDPPVGGIYLRPYLDAMMLLARYYRECGKSLLAAEVLFRRDSLRDCYVESDIWYKNRELTERYRNQDLRVRIAMQDQQLSARKKMLAGISLLCLALIGIIMMMWIIYRQRQHRLDAVYRKQKELECLEHRVVLPEISSSETALFRKLGELVIKEQLFRKPELSLDDLWPLAGSNRTYVSACINKEGGMNFSLWINKIRIAYALELIGLGEHDLTGIYVAAGFASQASFYRNFRLIVGMSPKQYLDRERKNRTFL